VNNFNFIDRDWFRIWKKKTYPIPIKEFGIVLSVYSPYLVESSDREKNGPYSSAVTFGVFKLGEVNNLIFFSMFPRKMLNPSQLITHTSNLCINYLNNSESKSYEGRSPDFLILPSDFETRNYIYTEIQNQSKGVPIRRFYYNDFGKTLDDMVVRIIPLLVKGRVWVCCKPDNINKSIKTIELRNVDENFLNILSSYPVLESMSTVWCLAQTMLFLESYGLFRNETNNNKTTISHEFYSGGI
jgi:hypothetical protein